MSWSTTPEDNKAVSVNQKKSYTKKPKVCSQFTKKVIFPNVISECSDFNQLTCLSKLIDLVNKPGQVLIFYPVFCPSLCEPLFTKFHLPSSCFCYEQIIFTKNVVLLHQLGCGTSKNCFYVNYFTQFCVYIFSVTFACLDFLYQFLI